MATGYTPGLVVSSRTTIEKTRRLPLKGMVLVKVGDQVTPTTVIARTELPGIMQTVKLAEQMGLDPTELLSTLQVKQGETIAIGTVLARTKGLFGMFKSDYPSKVSGTLELISEHTGHLGIRQAPIPIEKDAYINGCVVHVIPNDGAVIQCQGALIQGIFGVGGERQGELETITDSCRDDLTEERIADRHAGKVLVGGGRVTLGALKRAAELGVVGLVAGGVVDRDLIEFLRSALNDPSFDIGVAITGQEPIPFSLIVTEGFGPISMSARTFELFRTLNGRMASINGATQIRAGVIRPEVLVPLEPEPNSAVRHGSGELVIGTQVRIIREPHFGELGTVTALPSELVVVESETRVRVLEVMLSSGNPFTVPRANVEIIEQG